MPIANVVDGKLEIAESSQQTERKTNSTLGKEDFLQLLITQMKYQDPLDPADNTEYVAQLAQFSELEAMQNMNETLTNTTAFSLIGKHVYIEDQTDGGTVNKAEGTVDYVTMQNGKAYVSVDGELYPYDSVVEVQDDMYVISQHLPQIKKQQVVYRHHDPQNVVINDISMGDEGYEASSFAVAIVNEAGESTTVSPDLMEYSKGTLTIHKMVFETLEAGTYKIAFVFDDPNKTVEYDKVSLTVKGMAPAVKTDPDDTKGSGGAEGTEGGTEGSGTGTE